MATPKVFISSTCFDLGEIRDQLQKFVRSFGFEPILSEYGDIFYHPNLHTHDSCIYEVSNCQLFILIIGGRFGGHYISDRTKSITNAEYEAARKHKIPVFTYVRNGVLSSQLVYKQNKDSAFAADINYPSIEKKEHAVEIFKFIDEVRRSPTNNSVEGFDKFFDIEIHLKKQWAGMFFDFLKTAEVKKQIDATNHLISGLSTSSQKLEELVKSLYREISDESANKNIIDIEVYSKTEEFFKEILKNISSDEYLSLPENFNLSSIAAIDPKHLSWDQYLLATKIFTPYDSSEDDDSEELYIEFHDGSYLYQTNEDTPKSLIKAYEQGVKLSTMEDRERALEKLIQLLGNPSKLK